MPCVIRNIFIFHGKHKFRGQYNVTDPVRTFARSNWEISIFHVNIRSGACTTLQVMSGRLHDPFGKFRYFMCNIMTGASTTLQIMCGRLPVPFGKFRYFMCNIRSGASTTLLTMSGRWPVPFGTFLFFMCNIRSGILPRFGVGHDVRTVAGPELAHSRQRHLDPYPCTTWLSDIFGGQSPPSHRADQCGRGHLTVCVPEWSYRPGSDSVPGPCSRWP